MFKEKNLLSVKKFVVQSCLYRGEFASQVLILTLCKIRKKL